MYRFLSKLPFSLSGTFIIIITIIFHIVTFLNCKLFIIIIPCLDCMNVIDHYLSLQQGQSIYRINNNNHDVIAPSTCTMRI